MRGSDEGPKTEAALLLELPPSNQPGVFPRSLLPGGERVLFETRPGLLGLYVGRILLLFLLALLFLVAAEAPSDLNNPFAWFVFALSLFLIVYYILLWRATAYALTDRRVLLVSGLRRSAFLDAQYEQVQNLRLEPGFSGGLKFDATPPQAPSRLIGGRKYARMIFWRALEDAPRVQSFVQDAFALHERESAQAGLRDALIAKMTEGRFPCAYCRTLVDIRTVDFASPRCPSCGAPLVVPPS
ncbi:MAG: PH domain-containing protein [Thermoplasmata archaeon]|nr:PH domain-containing protein [Thermoplasmata archaeon]